MKAPALPQLLTDIQISNYFYLTGEIFSSANPYILNDKDTIYNRELNIYLYLYDMIKM
jgi:hypothetical protein